MADSNFVTPHGSRASSPLPQGGVDLSTIDVQVKRYNGLANPRLSVTLLVLGVLATSAIALYYTGQMQKWLGPSRFSDLHKFELLFTVGATSLGVFSIALALLSVSRALDVYYCKREARLPEFQSPLDARVIRPVKKETEGENCFKLLTDERLQQLRDFFGTYCTTGNEEDLVECQLTKEDLERLKESRRWATVSLDQEAFSRRALVARREGLKDIMLAGRVRLLGTPLEINVVGIPLPEIVSGLDAKRAQLVTRRAMEFAKQHFPETRHFVVTAHPSQVVEPAAEKGLYHAAVSANWNAAYNEFFAGGGCNPSITYAFPVESVDRLVGVQLPTANVAPSFHAFVFENRLLEGDRGHTTVFVPLADNFARGTPLHTDTTWDMMLPQQDLKKVFTLESRVSLTHTATPQPTPPQAAAAAAQGQQDAAAKRKDRPGHCNPQ